MNKVIRFRSLVCLLATKVKEKQTKVLAWIIPNAAKPQPKQNTVDTDDTDLHGLNIYMLPPFDQLHGEGGVIPECFYQESGGALKCFPRLQIPAKRLQE